MSFVIKHEIGSFYFEEKTEGQWTFQETKAKHFVREIDAQNKIDGKSAKNFLNRMENRIKIRRY